MKILLCFLLLFLFSCASTKKFTNEQPLKYSYLPAKLDIDLLMPPNENIIDTNLLDFKSIAIDSGQLISIYLDTLQIPSGVLISEKKAAQYIYFKDNCNYLDKKLILEKTLFNEYYDKSLESERVYQNEIVLLRKKSERSWLERNIVYFGFTAGIITTILTEFAVLHTKD
ncbi:MAG: hypothetical protein PHF86_04465 [Candidatus Nanoarchaeia archaeon]|jgi:hypothetical protein|nr:hypothetical protein [Candidatus Nanoarchaeia archaeon]